MGQLSFAMGSQRVGILSLSNAKIKSLIAPATVHSHTGIMAIIRT
jgi:hypothetical protein